MLSNFFLSTSDHFWVRAPWLRRIVDFSGKLRDLELYLVHSLVKRPDFIHRQRLVFQGEFHVQLLAAIELGVHSADQRQPVFDCQRAPSRVDRADEFGAVLGDASAAKYRFFAVFPVVAPHSATDLLARLEHGHLRTLPAQCAGRHQAGEAAAHDGDLHALQLLPARGLEHGAEELLELDLAVEAFLRRPHLRRVARVLVSVAFAFVEVLYRPLGGELPDQVGACLLGFVPELVVELLGLLLEILAVPRLRLARTFDLGLLEQGLLYRQKQSPAGWGG
jgi:hypothetical protein